MNEKFDVYVCEWNKKAEYTSSNFKKNKKNTTVYEEKFPNIIRYCESCFIFYDHEPPECTKCKGIIKSQIKIIYKYIISDIIYFLY